MFEAVKDWLTLIVLLLNFLGFIVFPRLHRLAKNDIKNDLSSEHESLKKEIVDVSTAIIKELSQERQQSIERDQRIHNRIDNAIKERMENEKEMGLRLAKLEVKTENSESRFKELLERLNNLEAKIFAKLEDIGKQFLAHMTEEKRGK